MTSHKLYELFHDYQDRLLKRFGAVEPKRDAEYTGQGLNDDTMLKDVAHLFWMVEEGKRLLAIDKVAKSMRWIGFLQHALLTLKMLTLEDIKQAARNHDEVLFPPPSGMQVMDAKIHVVLASPLGMLTVLVRQSWLPQGLQPQSIKWPNIDPDKRLPVLEDLGIQVEWAVAYREWDYTDCSMNLYLKPTVIHPRLSEESVALAIGLYKQHGWDYQDDDARKWPERWAKTKEAIAKGGGHMPGCPHHPQAQGPTVVPHGGEMPGFLHGLFGGMMGAPQIVMGAPGDFGPGGPGNTEEWDDDEDDEPPPPPKKRKRKPKKKNPPKGGASDAGEEGSPDAGGQ